MTEQTGNTRIPTPLYAAAGAGDLAYRQLRKLPTVVGDLSGRAVATGFELRERAAASLRMANTTTAVLREKATASDLAELRRHTAAIAQAAQERAAAVYTVLVARGERVVGSGVVQAADTVNADMEVTEAPAQVTASPTAVAAAVAERSTDDDSDGKATRTAKRTRAAK